MKHKEPTCTSRVEEVLRGQNDFMTYRMIAKATGLDINHVGASCCHLRKFGVVDVVVNPDGTGWWFALPSNMDQRSRIVLERAPESKPRRPRRRKNRFSSE